MSYIEPDDEPDPGRRALLGVLACLPVVGGGFELAGKLLARTSTRESARAGARAALSTEDQSLPFDKVAEAASERQERR